MKKKLAIVIPNYDRLDALITLIREIIKQVERDSLQADVQICISDDHSPKDPTSAVELLMKSNPDISISYLRKDKNEGMSRNFYDSVMMAEAEYCWIIGNDDIPENDGIRKVLRHLDSCNGLDFLVTPFDVYDEEGLRLSVYPLEDKCERIYDTNLASDRHDLFFSIVHNAGIFGFLSNVVFRKEIWGIRENSFLDKMGTLFIQMYMNIDKLVSGAIYKYTPEKIIKDGTDYETNGHIERLTGVLFGLDEVVEYFFTGDEKRHFKHVLTDGYISGLVWKLPDDNPYKKKLRTLDSEKNSVYSKYYIPPEQRKEKLTRRNIYIFGSGDMGHRAYQELREYDANILAVFDSDKNKEGSPFENLEIIHKDKMTEMFRKKGGIVIVANYYSLVDMVRDVEKMGIDNIGIIS